MESQLQSLIDKIKTDGVAEAEKQANDIVSQAQEKANKIVQDGKKQVEEIIADARNEAARTEDAGRKALEQAGRNLILGLQKCITDLFNRVLQKEIADALTPEALANILEKIAANWQSAAGDTQAIDVMVSKEDAETLFTGLIKGVQKKAKEGITLKPVEAIDAGFRVGEKDGNVYYDFTDKGIAEILSQYLNPKLAKILKEGKA